MFQRTRSYIAHKSVTNRENIYIADGSTEKKVGPCLLYPLETFFKSYYQLVD